MAEQTKTSFGMYLLIVFGIVCIAMGAYKCTKSFAGGDKSESVKKELSCEEIKSWESDDDIINSIQGTWVMDNVDYYGKRKFQFTGRTGRCWIMRNDSDEWVDDGTLEFEYSKKYDFNTKRNLGTEYAFSFKGNIGSFPFEADCVSGFFVPSDRYTYGIALLKVD